jgi:hypothetical protein
MVGDVNPNDPKISDESINLSIANTSSLELAAAEVCEKIAMRYATAVTETVQGVSKTRSEYERYMKRASDWRKRRDFDKIPFLSGGVSESDDTEITDDDDVPDYAFSRNQYDDPRASLSYLEDED